MAQQEIIIGAADSGEGEDFFTSFTKTQANFTELYSITTFTKRVLVNSLDDLPAAVSGVITLAANTAYFQANDLAFLSDRLVLQDNTSWIGLDTLTVNISYTGVSPFFTMVNASCSVKNFTITHPNSALFSFSDSGSHVLRAVDIISNGASLGNLQGTLSGVRFTNFSPTTTTSGLTFSGNFRVFLYEPSFAVIAAGSLIDLGSATFDSISITQPNLEYVTGSYLLSGLPNSGNINSGGSGGITLSRTFGDGTPLSGITIDDSSWEFHHNSDIQDTLRDALLSTQSTLTTAIATGGTFVKVNATWTVEGVSGFSADTTGKITWLGEKPIKLPVDMSLSLAPVSGTNKTLRSRLAVKGLTIANSERTTRTDSGDASSVTTPWQLTLQPNDYIEAFVTSDDATDLICSSGILRVN